MMYCIMVILSLILILINVVEFGFIYGKVVHYPEEIKKKNIIISCIIWAIFSIIFIFLGKNVLLIYLFTIAYMFFFTLYVVKFSKKLDTSIVEEDKVFDIKNDWFVCIAMYNVMIIILLLFSKLNDSDLKLYILEMSLLYLPVSFYYILNLYKTILPQTLKNQMKRIIAVFSILYILFVIFINTNYMYVKGIFVVLVLILLTISGIKKINELAKIIICIAISLIFIVIMFLVYAINIEGKVISRNIETIHVNTSKRDIVKYKIGDRFIFYDEEKIKNNERLIIYNIVEENGNEVIKECGSVSDYKWEKATLEDEWYLEEITEKLQFMNNNLKRNKKSYSDYIYYYLYCK